MRPTISYITQEQFNSIIDYIPRLKIRKWLDRDIAMLFKILYWALLRPSEGIKLEKKDIDLELHKIYLHHTKTQVIDEAIIPPDFHNELKEWLDNKPDGRLFEDLTYDRVLQWIIRMGKDLDIMAWVTPQSESGEKTKGHIFRKSSAKDLLYGTHDGRKAPINLISAALRHTGKNKVKRNIETTTGYLKLGSNDVLDWYYDQ